MRQTGSLFLVLLLILILICSPVSAQSITYSDVGQITGSQELLIYNSSTAFQVLEAVVNTSGGTFNYDPNFSYMTVIRPTTQKSWFNPPTLLENTKNLINDYGLTFLVIGLIVLVVIRRK